MWHGLSFQDFVIYAHTSRSRTSWWWGGCWLDVQGKSNYNQAMEQRETSQFNSAYLNADFKMPVFKLMAVKPQPNRHAGVCIERRRQQLSALPCGTEEQHRIVRLVCCSVETASLWPRDQTIQLKLLCKIWCFHIKSEGDVMFNLLTLSFYQYLCCLYTVMSAPL